MSFELAVVLITLSVATFLFVTEWVSFDVTAILIVGALVFTGVLEPAQALSGFSNEATIAIASMLVLSDGLRRTGVLESLVTQLKWLCRKNRTATLAVMLTTIGVISGFMNNTAVVAIFIPVVMAMAPDLGRSPSKLLIPMSFISIFGGVCTLIGTSTNLLVSSIGESSGLAPISMFELTPLGAILFVFGLLYLFFIAPHLLPTREESEDLTERYEMADFLSEVEIRSGFAHEGERQRDENFTEGLDLDILDVRRDGRSVASEDERWQVGDVLRVRAEPEELGRLLEQEKLKIRLGEPLREEELAEDDQRLVEVVIAADTGFVGSRIEELDFEERFGARVLAVRQRGEVERETLLNRTLEAGDSLLLLVDDGREKEIGRSSEFVVASKHPIPSYRRDRALLAVLILVAVVATAAVGLVPIAVSALLGCAAMVICGCLRADEAYSAINWKIIILLAGVMPLGIAMKDTGAASLIGTFVLERLGGAGPQVLVGGLLALAMLMTNLMTNVAAAAVLAPIAIQAGEQFGMDPRPLVIAITFGASLSFLSPIGYQTNTLVYSPGQYRYVDFVKVGTPLSIVCCVLGGLLIPVFWPV